MKYKSCFGCIIFLVIRSGHSVEPVEDDSQISMAKCHSTSGCNFPWHYCDNGTCTCAPLPPWGVLRCIGASLNISSLRCATFDQLTSSTFTGHCPFSAVSNIVTLPYIPHELDEVMCGDLSRKGILCSKCKDDHYTLAHSFDMNCVKCPNGKSNWWKYVLATFLPLTIFYLVVVWFRINITSSHLLGFVFCCQGLVMPPLARLMLVYSTRTEVQNMIRYIGLLYSIWNLDFIRFLKLDICLGTDMLQTLALEFLVGVYPLLLLLLSYLLIRLYDSNYRILVWIWKPFNVVFGVYKRNWDIKTSLIDTFSTFFLLSTIKLLNVSFDLLAPVSVYQVNSTGHLSYSWRLYYNATVPYFGEEHLPYATVSIAVLVLFVLLPTLLLIVYPLRRFQRLLNILPISWLFLHTFMDTFQGCFKDGTELGTRDYRWFSSVYFIVRFLMIIIGAVLLNATFYPIVSIILALTAILFYALQPFKLNIPTSSGINAIFFLLLAMFYVSISGFELAHGSMKQSFLAFGSSGINAIFFLLLAMFYVSISGFELAHGSMKQSFLAFGSLVSIVMIIYVSVLVAKWILKRKFRMVLSSKLRSIVLGYNTFN